MRKVDLVLKEIKPLFDELKDKDRAEALAALRAHAGLRRDERPIMGSPFRSIATWRGG